MSDDGRPDTTRVAGTLRLSAWHLNDVTDETGRFRRRYGYMVESTDSGATHEGDDLRSGAGAPVDAEAAVRTLASFLSAAGESYRYVLEHPNSEPENLDLFPLWVAEAAFLNADELATFDLDDEGPNDTVGEVAGPARFIGVVFQQGDDAAETLAILDEHGLHAAVEHLAQWDFGRDTEEAAKVFGDIYDEMPIGAGDDICVSGDYVMTYSHSLGHVGLVRKLDPSMPTPPTPTIDAPTTPETRQRKLDQGELDGRDESPWARPAPSLAARAVHPTRHTASETRLVSSGQALLMRVARHAPASHVAASWTSLGLLRRHDPFVPSAARRSRPG